MSYASEYTASHPAITSPTFGNRVEMMLVSQAGNVYNENPNSLTNPATHPARASYARQLAQPGGAAAAVPAWVELCAAQGLACDNTTTDAQIDAVAGSEWNLMAGA